MSLRMKVIEYISENADPIQNFIPFLNERGPNGILIKGMRKIKHFNNVKQSRENNKDKIISLDYLRTIQDGSQDVKRNKSISQQINRQIKNTPTAQEKQIGNHRALPNKNNFFQLNKTMYDQRLNHKNSIGRDRIYSKQSVRLSLVNRFRNCNQELRGFMDYSVDSIKPKHTINIVFKKEKPCSNQNTPNQNIAYKDRQKNKQNLFIAKNDTKNMYDKMIKSINIKVTKEILANPHERLRPQKEFSFKDIQDNIAEENSKLLLSNRQIIDDHRDCIKQLSSRIENIIYYRRYGERDVIDDELMRSGKLKLF